VRDNIYQNYFKIATGTFLSFALVGSGIGYLIDKNHGISLGSVIGSLLSVVLGRSIFFVYGDFKYNKKIKKNLPFFHNEKNIIYSKAVDLLVEENTKDNSK